MKHELFPIFLKLDKRRVLVGGGGTVALAKTRSLLATGARITVVALEINPRLRQLAEKNPTQLRLRERKLRLSELKAYDLAILATNDRELNRKFAREATRQGILVNSVDDPVHCDFYAAAVIRRGPLRIAVSSSGQAPGLSAALRKLLEETLPQEDLAIWRRFAAARRQLKKRLPDAQARSRCLLQAARALERGYFNLEE